MTRIMSLPYVILGAVALAGISSFGTWKFTRDYMNTKHELAVALGNAKAAQIQHQLSEAKVISELKLNEVKNEINADHEKRIRELDRTVLDLRNANIRLRDPGNKGSQNTCSTNPGVPNSSPATNPGTPILSQEATEFLLGFARDADETLEQLRTCKNWVTATKKELDSWTLKWNVTKD